MFSSISQSHRLHAQIEYRYDPFYWVAKGVVWCCTGSTEVIQVWSKKRANHWKLVTQVSDLMIEPYIWLHKQYRMCWCLLTQQRSSSMAWRIGEEGWKALFFYNTCTMPSNKYPCRDLVGNAHQKVDWRDNIELCEIIVHTTCTSIYMFCTVHGFSFHRLIACRFLFCVTLMNYGGQERGWSSVSFVIILFRENLVSQML